MGGFARRASYISKFRDLFYRTPSVLIDAGNFSADVSEEAWVRNRWVLEGMLQMRYAAVNIGLLEAIPETDRWNELKGVSELPLISANAHRPGSGELLRLPYVVREIARTSSPGKPIRLGILGLTKVSAEESLSVSFSEPMEAASRFVPELRQKCDVLVVASTMELEDAKELVRNVAGIDVLIGAASGNPAFAIESDTLVCYAGEYGMLLGDLRLFFDEKGGITRYFHRLVPLSALFEDEPSFVDFQKKAVAEIAAAKPR